MHYLSTYLIASALLVGAAPATTLETSFTTPPASARPWVYWFPLSGNLTKQGITADLEAMARVGIGGVLYMEVDQGAPKGAADFAGPLWMEMFSHACREAKRLGLEINMNNDAGWNGSGGPWITPEMSMQKIVASETRVTGPLQFHAALPQPPATRDYYRDIVVQAFRTPVAETGSMKALAPKITTSVAKADPSVLLDHKPETAITFAKNQLLAKDSPPFIQLEFAQPFTARSVTLVLSQASGNVNGVIQASDDGRTFHDLHKFTTAKSPATQTYALGSEAVAARYFRVCFSGTERTNRLDVAELDLSPALRLNQVNAKAFGGEIFKGDSGGAATSAAAELVVRHDQTLDLTSRMDGNGMLTWDVPAGEWTILRFGHTTTGKENHPAPVSGMGLECDKLSAAAATLHFDNLMGKIIKQNQAFTGQDKTLVGVHIDSWENGSQNWTPRMREEFRQRRGYDLLPFLPVITGRVVDSPEVSERFLGDLRQTVSDLLVANYAGTFRELAHRNGLRLTIEAYGEPADDMAYAGISDEPMGEFWAWPRYSAANSCTEMASAAHTYGKQIIGAEAFTARNDEKWQGHPANIKDLGDWAFCEGINRFVFHRYAAQPFLKAAPGMSMGPWGLHYERTQTWWEQSKAWHAYLTRCQSLLQQGQFVADIAYLAPEGAPREFKAPPEAEIAPHIRSGYGFDGCSAEVVLTRMSVRDGRLVLPDGMSYRALVLPASATMTPALLAKVRQLADAGAMIVGPATPPNKALGLADLGAGDANIEKSAAALWASGKILTGKTAQEFLTERGVPADFTAAPLLRFIHRRIGEAEVYFVANPQSKAVEAVADFRVTGHQPELWWPDSGRMESGVSFQESKGVTRVPLHLDPCGSVFVVFRKPSAGIDPVVALRHDGDLQWSLTDKPPTSPASDFKILKATYGVPNDPARSRDVTQKVQAIVNGGELKIPVSELAKGDDPAFGVVKTLAVEYAAHGHTLTTSGQDKAVLTLEAPAKAQPLADLQGAADGGVVLSARQAGNYQVQSASGKTHAVQVAALPAALELTGPWQVRFDPAAGGPGEVTFPKLEDWAQRPEAGIRYYSGTAAYQTTFVAGPVVPDQAWTLDLGKVEVMAEVKLNGKELGILWKPPYQVDVTAALQPGANRLELKVVNLWINRQIGDENLPDDSERNANGTLKAWPAWVQQEQPSPTGRISFSSWRLWKKGDPLSPSGLLGPVTVSSVVKVLMK